MGIMDTITNVCKQTAVYWGAPIDDGYGGYSYDSPVEIACRWENKIQSVQAFDGEIVISPIQVYVLQDVELKGLLYLGSLDDLDSDLSPTSVEAYSIKMFQKIPLLGSSSEFLRKVFLGWQTRSRN